MPLPVVTVCCSTLKPYSLGLASSARSCSTINTTNSTTQTAIACIKYLTLMKQMSMNSIEESNVGIFCYVSDLPGFRGVLKQRYSDFIVNEVDSEGNVTHLTTLDAPQEVVEEESVKTIDAINNKSYACEIESFKSLAGDLDAKLLEDFINQINSGSVDSVSPIVLSANSDKSHRTELHKFFKENFKFLVTDTIDGPDNSSKCIRIRLSSCVLNGRDRNSKKRKERGDKPFDSRGSENWPENAGKFLRFHLYKENKDTQEALGLIAKMLGIQQKSFGFAGTKDKRSVSTQRVTAFKQKASRLASLNKRLIGIKVGDFCYVKEGLLLGQLLGNRFTVTLRGVVAGSEDIIKASADALGRNGFVNYFGLQRFGTGSVPTHLIGAALLRGEWKDAVDMIIDPREGEKDAITKAREYFKNVGDIEGTLKQLPRHLVAERALLQCLKKCPGNYLQALKAIPRTLRMMYVHSYQSYLWNHAATKRVEKYGTDQVVLGDLVYCKDGTTKGSAFVGPGIEDVDVDDDSHDTHHVDDISGSGFPQEQNHHVKVVIAEDLDSEVYSIDDVILPLPGSRVIYPANDVAEAYHVLAKKDAVDLMESMHKVKEFSITSMTGSYRRIFQKPMDFEWELLTYTDSNKTLVETDLEKIVKTKPAESVEEMGAACDQEKGDMLTGAKQSESMDVIQLRTESNETLDEGGVSPTDKSVCVSDLQQSQLALKLSFTLPSSCYATMAVRELLKTSTSVAFHKALNQ